MTPHFEHWLHEKLPLELAQELIPMRNKALDTAQTLGKPSLRQEIWKYSSIEAWALKYNPSFQSPMPALDLPQNRLFGNRVYDDPNFHTIDSNGLELASLPFMALREPQRLAHLFGSINRRNDDVFAELNTAAATDGLYLHLKEGIQYPNTFSWQDAAGFAKPLRCLIHLEKGARLDLVYRFEPNEGTTALLHNQVWEIHLEPGAQLHIHRKLACGEDQGLVHLLVAHLAQKASLHVHTASFKTGFQRLNYFVDLAAPQAHAELIGIQAPCRQHHINTRVDLRHLAPNCTSHQEFRSLARDQAQAVFSGKILVERDAQQTKAYQHSAGLILSPNARIYAKPVLEIYADDVRCSHGATTGQLDDDALFYLRSRGIPTEKAQALLTQAFYGHLIDKLPEGDFRTEIETALSSPF